MATVKAFFRTTTKKADIAEAEVVAETPAVEAAVEPAADSSTDKAAE